MNDIKILLQFLNMPLGGTGEIFAKFRELDGAEHRGEGKEQFLYRRGSRDDRVLLVAHADTVWSGSQQEIVYENGIIRNKKGGLGADDRAGCAMVWLLRDLGHSLLIVDGEESGREGSKWLMEANTDIGNEINNEHNFVVEFDRCNGRDYKCYDVGTPEFRHYLEAVTGYAEPNRHSYTDIGTLCREIPGANLSVGYRDEHSDQEYLVEKEWQNTLDMCRKWLGEPGLPAFRR
jgi:hypothetical protein